LLFLTLSALIVLYLLAAAQAMVGIYEGNDGVAQPPNGWGSDWTELASVDDGDGGVSS
jgi:hypothetical protein